MQKEKNGEIQEALDGLELEIESGQFCVVVQVYRLTGRAVVASPQERGPLKIDLRLAYIVQNHPILRILCHCARLLRLSPCRLPFAVRRFILS